MKVNKHQIRVLYILIVICSVLMVFSIDDIENNDFNNLENNIHDLDSQIKLSYNPPNQDYFNYYKEITINHSKVSEDLTNFPLLISIYDSDLRTEAQADGDDIAFSNSSDWLDHEFELFDQDFNGTHARLIAWIRIPLLSSTIDTKIYMYYGNTTMQSRQSPSGVWNSDFKAVWHLNTTLLDSTSNNNDGTNYQANDGAAYIANGRDYDGADDYSNMGSGSSIDNIFNGGATISAWIKPEDNWGGASYGRVLDKSAATSGTDGWVICIDGISPWPNQLLFYRDFSGGRGLWMSGDYTINLNEWQHIVVAYDDSLASNDPNIYINGILESFKFDWEDEEPTGTAESDHLQSLYIGNYMGPNPNQGSRGFNGIIDEVRICSGIKTSGWIQTEYNNQDDPTSFYTIGSPIEIDKIPPSITIKTPINKDLFGMQSPNFNVEINDNSNIDKKWYRLSNGTITTVTTTFNVNDSISQTRWDEIGNGTLTIQFYANDSWGNIGFSEVTVRKDIVSPVINVITPNDLDLFGNTAPTYNVEIQDVSSVDSMWYTLNDGPKKYFAVNGTINQTLWNGCENGSVSIKFYANDSVGNQDFSEVIVRKDINNPLIIINTPDPFDLFGQNPPSYNVRINDPSGIGYMWYTLNDSVKTFFTVNETISQTLWDVYGNGVISIKFYANDSLGNEGFFEVVVQKDIEGPIITINSPNKNELFGAIAPSFNITVLDLSAINSMWYTIDGGLTNITFNTNGTISQPLWNLKENGTVTIIFYAKDSLGNEGFSEVIVRKDIDPPSILINNPFTDQLFGAIAPVYNVEVTDINGIDTMWYSLDGGLTNTIFTTNGSINPIIWDNFGDGIITIRFYANNSIGSIGFSEVVIIKDVYSPVITINTPYNNSYCNKAPIINIIASDINLDKLWCKIGSDTITLPNSADFELNSSIWNNLPEGFFQIFIYSNDTLGHLNDTIVLMLCKDTISPSAPTLLTFPVGEVSLPIIFDWEGDATGIAYYRLIIDTEDYPFGDPGFIFEINITNVSPTSSYYELLEYLTPRNYYFFIYQIDMAGNQGSAAQGPFIIKGSSGSTTEFPWWIILAIAAPLVLALVIVGLKKSKKKEVQVVIIDKELDKLKEARTLLDTKAKNALKAYNYIKAAEFYEECAQISYQLFNEGDKIEQSRYKHFKELEMEARSKAEATPLRVACINNILTKFFDENGIKYYSNPQIYPENQDTINGLILNDNNFLQNRFTKLDDSLDLAKELHADLTNLENVNAIQILYTIDLSPDALIDYCQKYQNPDMMLYIVGIEWPAYNYGEKINLPKDSKIKYPENIKVINVNLFSRIFLLSVQNQEELQNIITLNDLDQLKELNESIKIDLHNTEELKDELKQKGWFFLI